MDKVLSSKALQGKFSRRSYLVAWLICDVSFLNIMNELASAIIGVINVIFAALGIFVTAENLLLRAKSQKTIPNDLKGVESPDTLAANFGEKFLASRLGAMVADIHSRLVNRKITILSSKSIQPYRRQGYISFTKIFHAPDMMIENSNLAVVSLAPCSLIIVIAAPLWVMTESNILVFSLLLFGMSFYLLPFGLYGDYENGSAKVVYGPFSLGNVTDIQCVVMEQPSGDFHLYLVYFIHFFLIKVKMPKLIRLYAD